MARRRIRCYIAFKTRISFKKDMKRGAPGPEDVKSEFVREGSVGGDKAHKRKRFQPCIESDKAFNSLRTPNQHIIWQHSGYVFVCKGCGKKFKTENNINIHEKVFGFKTLLRKCLTRNVFN